MLPSNLNTDIIYTERPSKTYHIVIDKNRIDGITDGINSVSQAIYLILNTERYAYPIYSWDYGIQLSDLIGMPMKYVISVIPDRITEALKADDRVKEVKDFSFETKKNKLYVYFTVVTTVGNIEAGKEVSVNV